MKNHSRRRSSAKKTSRRPRPLRKRPLRLEQLEGRFLLAGNPLFRINAGGAALAGSPNWLEDTAANPSAYVNATTGNSVAATTNATIDVSDPSIPAGTPAELFQSERWDKPGGGEMQWSFPVTPGEYEVRLYFAEAWTGAQAPGVRQFDVQVEGNTVLDNYDIFADIGGFNGVVKSFTVNSDANLDVDFFHVLQNPSVRGIEIIDNTSLPNTLVASVTSLDFGSVVTNNSLPRSVTLTNGGSVGSPAITIDPSQASVVPAGSPFTVEFQDTQPIVLSPGESTVVTVTYTPTALGTDNATLSVVHSGSNSPVDVSLSGVGVASAPINFAKSTLAGAPMTRPTKVQFGPDGRLYVAQQNGLILIFTIARNGLNDYQVVAEEQLTIIQDMPNHNDDGTLNPAVTNRLVTGMLVAGTAQNPVLYVSNSDPRIGAGATHADLNLDTNSGTVSRVTWNGTSWEKLDLVRGLPRSEENHGTNGMALDATANTLYLAVGGNTNMGAPSLNFALLPEYALSAAILSIDLNAIGESTYDLPTLDDEDRPGVNDLNDPFGGNDGKNQAIIVPGGPVQVYSPGFRNPYDLHITTAGRMYVTDNGPNAGWGDIPIGEGPEGNATNDPNEPGITLEDQLHFVPGPGFYGGHPNPTRSNPANTFNATNPQSPVALVGPNSVESDYLLPVVEDGALLTVAASTNGLDEYTPSTFGGELQGDLIIASFDNTVKRVKLNAAGDAVVFTQNLFSNVGVRPLDVDVADSGSFAGIIVVADIGLDSIFIYEPADQIGNPDDLDGDGYSNDDEIANGTDPNNSGDIPPDFDMDFLSNLLDDDDDNDSLLDNADRFAVDANNGSTTPVGTLYDWENEGANNGGLLDLGFTGMMTNGVDDYESLFNPLAVTAGGAAGVFTIDSATVGTARGATNSQEQAYQFGVNVAGETVPFSAKSSVVAPFLGLVPLPGQEMGMFIGTGDQDNYVQIVLSGDNGGSVQLAQEIGGVFTLLASHSLALPGPGFVDFELVIDPLTDMAQARYSVDGAAFVDLGAALSIPAAWLNGVLAVGVISTDPTGSGAMPVTWDFLGIVSPPATGDPEAFLLIEPPGGGLLTSSVFLSGTFRLTNNSTGNVRIQSVTIDISTALLPDIVFDPFGLAGNDVGKEFTPDSGALETGLLGHENLNPRDGGFDVLKINFSDFDPGETLTFSVDVEPTSIQGSVPPGPNFSGHINGLEMTRSTVTVVFSDGTTTQTQTFRTPGISKSSQTTADTGLPLAPGLALLGTVTPPAVVSDANQILRVSGPAGAAVRLLQAEAALSLTGVPDGGFDIDPFEVNKVVRLEEYAATIDATGFVDVPVTLLKTDPEGGYNYFVATIQDAAGRTGDVSSTVILKFEDLPVVSGSAARVNVYSNGSLKNSSTTTAGSIQIVNQSTSGENITSVMIDLTGSLLPDVVFDPTGAAGDVVGKTFTPNSGTLETGQSSFTLGGTHDGGFDSLVINFTDFNPGETFTFSIDIDPTSVQGVVQPGPQGASSISGLELSGATVTIQFADGAIRMGDLFAVTDSKVNAHVILDDAVPTTPAIAMVGVPSTPAIVTSASQTVRITGSPGAVARLLQTESALLLAGVPGGGFDIDPFETNKVIFVKHTTVTIGAGGFVDIPVVLNDSHVDGGVNHFLAVVEEVDGRTGEVSNALVVALSDVPTGVASDAFVVIPGDYDGSGTVDNLDYAAWKSAFGEIGDELMADGNGNGVVDSADYTIWRDNLGQTAPPVTSGGTAALAATASTVSTQSFDTQSFAFGPTSAQSTSRPAARTVRDRGVHARPDGADLLTIEARLVRQALRDRAFGEIELRRDELPSSGLETCDEALCQAFASLGFTKFKVAM